ncbi:Hypp4528 [Branchiostoma lanceolatum]|uniref:Hypp4528 protein n=1 Tax=Branchiostoma lanceolatum TaxID=7740 RepID=A0A8K0AA00_BRALA|nr:Hypp4528 [Branchiostoma lanceolatum]
MYSIDALSTFCNLITWGKRNSDRCKLCGNRETLHHVLNHCSVSLQQGRHTFRHNAISKHITDSILEAIDPTQTNATVYADIQGHTTNGGTVPAHILPTTQKPDLVTYLPAPTDTTPGNSGGSTKYKVQPCAGQVSCITTVRFSFRGRQESQTLSTRIIENMLLERLDDLRAAEEMCGDSRRLVRTASGNGSCGAVPTSLIGKRAEVVSCQLSAFTFFL